MDAIGATITFLLLFMSLSSAGTRAETQPPKNIPPGSSLFPTHPPTSWLSPSGLFAFGFYRQDNGFVVGIWLVGVENNNTVVVWTANRDDPPVTSNAKLQLTLDGKLVVVEQGQEKLIANANATASFASMLDSGNLVLYNNDSSIIWQSFDHPTDTMLGGQSLPCGSQLLSNSSAINPSTGRFLLVMQGDGNLVLYPANTANTPWDAYWATGIVGFKYHLYLNKTGSLQIRDSNNLIVRYLADNINNGNSTIYRATLDFDGFFRLYEHVNKESGKKVKKSWPSGNACEVKGLCGFNSFCALDDNTAKCNCLRGFDFIDPNKETLGCKRSFSKADCRGEKDGAAFYNMVSMENIKWGDSPYYEAEMSEEEECSYACLADCNCWAALYDGGSCKKHGLPLRYVSRSIYEAETQSSTVFLKVGNDILRNWKGDDKPVAEQPPLIKSASNKAMVHIIVVTSVFSVLLCSTIAISSHYMYKIRVLMYKRLMETGNMGLNEELALRRFSYGELKRATNHFKQELGKGSFGAVYKGALNKGRRLIAVKRLEKLVEEGEREFQAEMRAIGKTHHRNLVRLLGFCAEGSKRLLVYEYMRNGSLGNLIFGAQRIPDWDERVKIALDVARGILYLHEECEAPIIHCDIKPQNILMDEFWTAKISDFGLAKLLMPDQTRTFTGVRGTRGYVAPEWHKNTPISVKVDVYSYGIVLLETLCCRRNIEVNVSEPEEVLLTSWAYKCFVAGEFNRLVLLQDVDINVLENMVKVALWCINDEPVLRPTMKSVLLMLEGITDIAIPPCPNSISM
ncbi:G-type lectin S-receptor-like serine/threonine-protein kinase LECRK1 [Gastrolobium bilobum]|uniref:G-type lectin S-receptor-like serine/threonine-protein kinase LECRK1 n=1 Tax=Gastrolobium bilobum TaxID=150636 RepID=UPI002AAF6E1A|nr:G-type lectin S-receptor-like serine/threonine-protein kinase LECRK1 [Gastrolobium bilobum]